jgi:hypothetical protein
LAAQLKINFTKVVKVVMGAPHGHAKAGGRTKGTPNKTTALLKDAILDAAILAGADGLGKDGLVGYLNMQAKNNSGPFLSLLGKVLPLQVIGDADNPLNIVHQIERRIVGEIQNSSDPDTPRLLTAIK